jgi:hypothetical protein
VTFFSEALRKKILRSIFSMDDAGAVAILELAQRAAVERPGTLLVMPRAFAGQRKRSIFAPLFHPASV